MGMGRPGNQGEIVETGSLDRSVDTGEQVVRGFVEGRMKRRDTSPDRRKADERLKRRRVLETSYIDERRVIHMFWS